MMTNQMQSVLSRFSRVSAAGILIAFSGTALALADGSATADGSASADAPASTTANPTTGPTARQGAVVRRAAAAPARRNAASVKAESERLGLGSPVKAPRIGDIPGADASVPGGYTHVASLLRTQHPQLSGLSDRELFDIVQKRAAELRAKSLRGTAEATDLQGGKENPEPPQAGSQGAIIIQNPGGRIQPHMPFGPGEWGNRPGIPALGEGYRADVSHKYLEDLSLNLARLELRSRFGDMADFSNLAFADVIRGVDGGGRWDPLALPSNTQDFDGDGELFDPLPARPIVVYYQFLEENMTDLEWDQGEDNFNQVRLTTDDTNEDDAIDLGDDADETDGIADTWLENPAFVNLSIIPPPVFADFDEELAPWLVAAGFGPIKWGDSRPLFFHPDAEAAWRLAQRLYYPNPADFELSFDSSQVLEVEERQTVLAAMRAIEDVTNITFLERPDLPEGSPPTSPFGNPFNRGYPLNAVGYSLDTSGPVVVDPGGISGLPGASEYPWQPEDDHPWILIAKGTPIGGAEVAGGSSIVGNSRNLPAAPNIDYFFTDLDGDGFPDTPDSDGDGVPDQIIFSALNAANIFAAPADIRAQSDTNGDGVVDVLDSSMVAGLAPFPPGGNFNMDLNFDGAPDFILDTNADGDPAVVSIPGDLAIDFEGDGVPDSVFPGGTVPSPVPFPQDAVPCELLSLSQGVLDNQVIGQVVYNLMRHLGFLNEQQRPDREDFIRVNIGNIDADSVGLFTLILGGPDKYANFIENFDTTSFTVPPTAFDPRLPGLWEIAGTPASGVWGFAEPAPGDGIAPVADFAVNEDDDSTFALVTGAGAGVRLVGETAFTSPSIYGPEDAFVRFAYFLNSTDPSDLIPGNGLLVQTSADEGVTWSTVLVLNTVSDEWREAQFTVGDVRNDGGNGLPEFRVRFIARNSVASRPIEMGLDRIRVQNPYDFLSVMHFGEFAGSRFPGEDGFQSMDVRPPNTNQFQPLIGAAAGLSIGDRIGLSNLYGDPVLPDGDAPAPDPCRADVNGDGTISAVDVALFLELFNAGDPRADFADPIGVIDIFDLVQFFNDVQQSFRCLNDPDNQFGFNNISELSPPG